jgi:preprotein translocase subunit SecF
MFDLVGRRYYFFLLSLLVIVPGVVSLLIPPALRLGIDFTSGTTMTLRFQRPVDLAELRAAFAEFGHPDAVIQVTGGGDFIVRTRPFSELEGGGTEESARSRLVEFLQARFGPVDVLDFATISPVVAAETVRNSALAVAAASVGILLYLTFAFRSVRHPFRYGVCAVVALLHDALVVIGIFSILGKVAGVEVDTMFITALLTVIGFSVHDTIVVFDRIRENARRLAGADFPAVVNYSLLQTVGRSLNTSLTVVFTLTALLLFGGVTIRTFVLALLIGIISGTYSSIFNASMLLVAWNEGDFGRLTRRIFGLVPARG